MTGGLLLGKLFGIRIQVHFSWVFVFFLVAWSLASSYLPTAFPGWSHNTYWTIGIVGSLLLFVSVLVHELSHSMLALFRGHKVKAITLFLFGGVSEIEEEARQPGEEFWIAVVGPMASFLLAGVAWALYLGLPDLDDRISALALYLGTVNLAVGAFNLIPGFPLDGGRVLRAVVWRTTGSLSRATMVAATVGTVIGFGFMVGGVIIALVTRDLIGGLWLAFIGWFLLSSASSSRQQVALRSTLTGMRVKDAMRTNLPAIAPGVSVQQLVEEHITRDFEGTYLVMLGDTFYGLVTATQVNAVPVEERGRRYVTEVMTRAPQVVAVSPDDPLETALQRLLTLGFNQLVVMDGGRPVGLVTRGDVLRVLEVAKMFPSRPRKQG